MLVKGIRMQTAQGAAREICQHYYPATHRYFESLCRMTLRRQEEKALANPDYNVYDDDDFTCHHRLTVEHQLNDYSKHERVNIKLLLFYGYAEGADVCWPDMKLPKDSLNRLFLLLARYNKAIKRKADLNMKKILRGIVLKEVLEPLVEFDTERIPLTE